MGGAVARNLRRLADVLQRSLFDEPADAGPRGDEPADAGGNFDGSADGGPSRAEPEPPAVPPPLPDVLRHPQANRRASLDGQTVFYALRRSRRRSLGFVVGSDGLAVSAPRRLAVRDIDAGLREKSAWILAKLAEQGERNARHQAARIVWRDGATFRYLGRPVRVVLDRRADIAGAAVLEPATASLPGILPSILRVGLPPESSAERLRDVVESWLQRQAMTILRTRCDHFAALLGVRVTRLALSSAQTRWGSASAAGAVRLHWRLVHFGMATIDYVVAHELAHLREMNHGSRFWALVRSVVADVDGARRDLKSERLSELG